MSSTYKKGKCGIESSGDKSIESAFELNEKLDFDTKAKMRLSGIRTFDGKHEEFDSLDLNIDQSELMSGRINNEDDINESFGGLDLNIAQIEFWFSEVNNVHKKDELGLKCYNGDKRIFVSSLHKFGNFDKLVENPFIVPVETLEEGPSEPDPKEPPIGTNTFHTTIEDHTPDHIPENTSENAFGDLSMQFVV
ncbi:hypothetical protein Tco_0215982 [Tanacetum coccineum]